MYSDTIQSYVDFVVSKEYLDNFENNDDMNFEDSNTNGYDLNNQLIDLYLSSLENKELLNSPNFELELRFFQDKKEYGGVSNILNKFQFQNVLKFLDNNYEASSKKNTELNIKQINNGIPKYSLDITCYDNNYVDFKCQLAKLRFTIEDKHNISNFCRNNKIDIKNVETIYKGSVPKLDNSLINVELAEAYKELFGKDLNNSTHTIDLFNNKVRLGGKLEMVYNKSESIDLFNHNDETGNEIISSVINTARKVFINFQSKLKKGEKLWKTFRLKERKSYLVDEHIRIDITKTKSSKVDIDVRFEMNTIPVSEFIDSGIKESDENYEVEIEIVDRKALSKQQIKEYIQKAIKLYKIITLVTNERNIFTDYNTSRDVKILYNEITKLMLVKKITHKLSLIDAIQKKNVSKEIMDNKLSYYNRISGLTPNQLNSNKKKLESMLKKYSDETFKLEKFMSPKVVSINMENVREENPDSIVHNYCVTDKADGLSSLMLIVGSKLLNQLQLGINFDYLKGHSFLIDSNLNISYAGNYFKDMKNTYIFNGEFLNYTKNRHMLNKYAIYDCYMYENEDITRLPLVSNDDTVDSRIGYSKKFTDTYLDNMVSNNNAGKNLLSAVNIFVKNFKISSSTEDIFKCSKDIWDRKSDFEYKLDGLIYTPANLPVSYSEVLNYDLYQWNSWFKNYKWKPPEDNTIDFLIRFEQEENVSYKNKKILKFKEKHIKSESGYDKYLIGNLFNKGTSISNSDLCSNKNPNNKYKVIPVPFKPKNPYNDDVFFGYFHTEYNEVKDLDGNIVENDTIVEVNYMRFNPSSDDYITNKNLRYNILRTRYDKTFQHKIAVRTQKFRYKKICKFIQIIDKNDIIFSPIEKKFIVRNQYLFNGFRFTKDLNINQEKSYIHAFKKNMSLIKSQFRSHEDIVSKNIKLNYGNATTVAHNIWSTIHNPVTIKIITTGEEIPDLNEEAVKYYNRKNDEKKDKSITIHLQTFHNKIIKSRILLENVVKSLRISNKEREISLLDLSCGVGGDIGKWINLNINRCVGIDINHNNICNDVDGALSRLSFYKNKSGKKTFPKIDFLVGDSSKTISDLKAFNSKYAETASGLGLNNKGTFDIITLMFSLHYFFESKETINNLIKNIDYSLSKDGFLIGACFNGKLIYEKLKSLSKFESIEDYKNAKWIWKIIKNYNNTLDGGLPDDEKCVGFSIKVAMRSINKIIEEYLVNLEYFKSELAKKNIVVLEESHLEHMDLPIIDDKKISIGSFSKVYDMINFKNEKLNSILKNVKDNLSDSEKSISVLNSYFILSRKTEYRQAIEEMTEIIITIINNNKKASEQNAKDFIKTQHSNYTNSENFDEQFNQAYSDAKELIKNVPVAEKATTKKRILKIKKAPVAEKATTKKRIPKVAKPKSSDAKPKSSDDKPLPGIKVKLKSDKKTKKRKFKIPNLKIAEVAKNISANLIYNISNLQTTKEQSVEEFKAHLTRISRFLDQKYYIKNKIELNLFQEISKNVQILKSHYGIED
jgi:SAM-dependent methyltransferase